MAYADWTDREWSELIQLVRAEAPIGLSDKEIREAAWGYMHHGADGGGNKFGIEGTVVALCVDKIAERRDARARDELGRAMKSKMDAASLSMWQNVRF